MGLLLYIAVFFIILQASTTEQTPIMKLKVSIDGESHEVDQSEIELPDGVNFISKDNVPNGFFTQDALEQKIKDRVGRAKSNAEADLLSDEDHRQKVLSTYGINLDSSGQPKGIKTEEDFEDWKASQAKQLTQPFKEEIENLKQSNENLKSGSKKADILKATAGLFKEQYTKSFMGDDDAFVIQQFGDRFDVDPETGQTALLDGDGFAVAGDGSRITPDKYFESNKDKFKELLIDKRQRGSGFQNGSDTPIGSFSDEDMKNMSDEQYEEHREDILKSMAEN
jgi:hypothetical protein